jgi:hypothetical protein
MQVRGTHALPPQRLASPPPPQVWPAGQSPHISSPPQPSETGPQVAPALAHVRRTQAAAASPAPPAPHAPGLPPPPQLWPSGQAPQSSSPPQPSPAGPQPRFCDEQVRGTQPDVPPHWLSRPPPPQVCGAAQVPQFRTPPQPSPIGPQVAPAEAQVTSPQPRRGTSPTDPPASPTAIAASVVAVVGDSLHADSAATKAIQVKRAK